MQALIAIGYQDETSAAVAAEALVRLAAQLGVTPDDIAVVSAQPGGGYRTTTRVTGSGRPGGSVFWSALVGALVLEPAGTPLGEDLHVVVQEGLGSPLGPWFAGEVRGLLVPGASVLFVRVDDGDDDRVLDALRRYGGSSVRTSEPDGPELPDEPDEPDEPGEPGRVSEGRGRVRGPG